jgi:chromosome segregation ATPase
MAFDLQSIALAVTTGGLGVLAAIFAPKFKRDEVKIAAELTRTANLQAAEDNRQARIFAALERNEAKIDVLNERINAQALEIALLTGKVQTLEYSENTLKLENARLVSENKGLHKKIEELDDENILQAQKISELSGRLAGAGLTP